MTLGECPPGLFLYGATPCFKSEYKTESMSRPGVWQSDAYVVDSGEYFWGGTNNPIEREALEVVPVQPFRCAQCHEIFFTFVAEE